MSRKITTTVQINDCERHPLLVTATWIYEKSHEGYDLELMRIVDIELHIGSKVGIDITKQVFADEQTYAIIEHNLSQCHDQVIEAIPSEEIPVENPMADFANEMLGSIKFR